MRNLAQRSAGAAKEIKTLIGDSVDKVDNGSRLVDEAGQTMGLIVTSIRQVADIMGEITAATHEQSQGIEEINEAISRMDEMTQQNSALVEEASAAAESMREQAGILGAAVSSFKLSAEHQAPARMAAPRPAARVAPSAAPAVAHTAAPALKAAAPRAAQPAAASAAASAAPKKLAPTAASEDWEEF